jgi:hypothetical protein
MHRRASSGASATLSRIIGSTAPRWDARHTCVGTRRPRSGRGWAVSVLRVPHSALCRRVPPQLCVEDPSRRSVAHLRYYRGTTCPQCPVTPLALAPGCHVSAGRETARTELLPRRPAGRRAPRGRVRLRGCVPSFRRRQLSGDAATTSCRGRPHWPATSACRAGLERLALAAVETDRGGRVAKARTAEDCGVPWSTVEHRGGPWMEYPYSTAEDCGVPWSTLDGVPLERRIEGWAGDRVGVSTALHGTADAFCLLVCVFVWWPVGGRPVPQLSHARERPL